MMGTLANLSRRLGRREFLRGSLLAGGGLLLGIVLPGAEREALAEGAESFVPNAFLRIDKDGTVTVLANHSEMGQGVYTSLPMLIAEELDADWSKVTVEAAPVDPVYNHVGFGMQATGGSTSTWTEWQRFRHAGATARAMLLTAGAAAWSVPEGLCRTENGAVHHGDGAIPYGDLVEAAAALPVPEDVTLKSPADFKLIGKSTPRLDTPAKTDGSAIFGIDVQREGMLVALVARSPVFGGKLRGFDATKAQAIDGVRHVIEIPSGVAVIADGFWPAKLGREALDCDWELGALAGLDSDTQREQFAGLAAAGGVAARDDGDAVQALSDAAQTLEAVYELPYLSHSPMEPLNCVADVREDACEVWVGTQFQTLDAGAAAQEAGLDPSRVTLHTTFLGGGFGRRAVLDSHFVREAVQCSKAVGRPVKVIWTREDDIHGGYYRPRAYHTLKAGLDAEGLPSAWHQRVVVQSFAAGTSFEGAFIQNGIDHLAVEGAADTRYTIPNLRVEWCAAPLGVPCLWWRSVGHSHTSFVVESFLDELAHAAGRDPLDYRRALLGEHYRLRGVLELAAEKAGWGTPLPEGRARGLAVHESFKSFVAHVVEVSLDARGHVRVHRVVCAIDCGPVVNPDTIEAQMQGCIVFGLSAALYGEISFKDGRVQQRNFHDYKMLRIHEMPVVEVHVVDSTDEMGGVGEPGVPPVAPALGNALFALTGKRVRRLPLRAEDLR